MSADLPSLRFPVPILALPPLPESTVEPLPPKDDPRLNGAYIGMSPADWYMFSALQNSDSYSYKYFNWEHSNVYMGDVVVPSFEPPENHPEAKDEDQATGWMMVCFTCPSNPFQEEPNRNEFTGYPFCDERMLSREPLVSSSTLEEPDLEVPISTVSDAESIMACTIQLQLNSSWTTTHTSMTDLDTLTGQFFIVNRDFRGPYPEMRYRYNETFQQGVLDEQAQTSDDSVGEYELVYPTTTTRELYWWEATSTAGYGYTGSTWDSSLDQDDDDDSNSRSKTGILIGTIVPFFMIIVVFALIWKLKRHNKTPTKAPAPVPRNLDAAADARRMAGLSERRYIARGSEMGYPVSQQESNGTVITVQDDPAELPPAYHKVVTNVERMEIERQMEADRNPRSGWPPTYQDARNSASTPLPRPASTASTPEQNRAPYPALPSSPSR